MPPSPPPAVDDDDDEFGAKKEYFGRFDRNAASCASDHGIRGTSSFRPLPLLPPPTVVTSPAFVDGYEEGEDDEDSPPPLPVPLDEDVESVIDVDDDDDDDDDREVNDDDLSSTIPRFVRRVAAPPGVVVLLVIGIASIPPEEW
jgi:hypothetical protein